MENLPYWASQYLEHMKQHRPQLYRDLQASNTLESIALRLDPIAKAFYQRQISYYQQQGDSATQAEIFADSDTMRQYICLAPEAADIALTDNPPP